jgi:hypothetical protein
MPTPTPTTLILHDSIPIGTDFIGSAAALPVSPAEPSQTVLGSDFAGGTVPLTAKVDDGEPAKQSPSSATARLAWLTASACSTGPAS